jgi:hypothetical protein
MNNNETDLRALSLRLRALSATIAEDQRNPKGQEKKGME